MENPQEKLTRQQIEEEKLKYQDEPFTYVEGEQKKPFPSIFWLQWGLLLVAGFYFASIFVDGFGGMHRYGVQEETGTNFIFLISNAEKFFFGALLLCLPAAVFLALFFEKFFRVSYLDKMKSLLVLSNAKKAVAAMMVLAGLAITIISVGILKQTPISDDENIYLFQARMLANGSFTLDSKPGEDAIFEDNIFLVNNGKVFGQYPFGHSIILVLGSLVGFPYLSQIVLAMLTILGVFLLARELYGIRAGLLAALLIALSPTFLFTSSTLLAHTNTLFFLTWFGYFAIKTVRDDKLLYPLLCGICFGAAFHIRGATTMLVGAPAGLVLAYLMFKSPRANLKKIVVLGGSVTIVVGLYLVVNALVNGDPFKTNYHAAWIGKTQFDSPFGFGKGTWRIIHTPLQGLLNAINNFIRLNAWLYGWPIGFLFVIVWAVQKGRERIDYLMLVPFVLSFGAYFFYFWPGISDTGPVLYFELLLPITLLTARGIEKTPALLSRLMPSDLAVSRTVLFLFMSVVLALCTFHAYNGKALAKIHKGVQEPYERMNLPAGEKAVVFTDYYFRVAGQNSWVAGRKNTHPDLGDEVLYVLDYGREMNQAFLDKYYPDYKGYVFHFKYGIADLVPLAQYSVAHNLKNYPDSR